MSENFEFLFLFQQLLTILVQNSITFISLLLTFLLISITQKNPWDDIEFVLFV